MSWTAVPTAQAEARPLATQSSLPPFIGLGPHTQGWTVRPIPLFPSMWVGEGGCCFYTVPAWSHLLGKGEAGDERRKGPPTGEGGPALKCGRLGVRANERGRASESRSRSVVSASGARCKAGNNRTPPKDHPLTLATCPQLQAHSPQPSPHATQGTLNVCSSTLAGSIPMLNTAGLPPSQPLKGSRINAESLTKCGCLPAPKIPPVIQGATVLASICGAGAAAVTERGLPLGVGWVPIWAYSPQSLRLPQA